MNKTITKIMLIISLSVVSLGQQVLGDIQQISDCWLVMSAQNNSIVDDTFKKMTANSALANNSVVNDQVLRSALNNLQSSCCIELKWNACDKRVDQAPVSVFLMDHLIDVSFRKLDAIDSELNGYTVTPDEDSKSYRTELKKIATDPKGNNAQVIQEHFKKYWEVTKASNVDSLSAKYRSVCQEARNIVYNNRVWSSVKQSYAWIFVNICKNLAENRIQKEQTYIKALIAKAAGQQYKIGYSSYTTDYLFSDRRRRLQEKVTQINGYYWTVVKRYEFTAQCNQ